MERGAVHLRRRASGRSATRGICRFIDASIAFVEDRRRAHSTHARPTPALAWWRPRRCGTRPTTLPTTPNRTAVNQHARLVTARETCMMHAATLDLPQGSGLPGYARRGAWSVWCFCSVPSPDSSRPRRAHRRPCGSGPGGRGAPRGWPNTSSGTTATAYRDATLHAGPQPSTQPEL